MQDLQRPLLMIPCSKNIESQGWKETHRKRLEIETSLFDSITNVFALTL